MPPFSCSTPSNGLLPAKTDSSVVTINVVVRFSEPSSRPSLSPAPNLSYHTVAKSQLGHLSEHFVDRDPELFSIILSLLRTGNLPSKAKAFDLQHVISESQFCGVELLLVNSVSNPSQFEAFNLEKSVVLLLNGRDTEGKVEDEDEGEGDVAREVEGVAYV